jgi:hypothetical protein
VTPPIRDFIEVRIFQEANLSARAWHGEILERFEMPGSGAFTYGIRRALSFSWRPARHGQPLNELQIDERIAFYRKMLGVPQWPGWIRFSEESWIVGHSDRMRVW